MAMQWSLMPQPKLIHGVQKSIIDPVSVVGNGVRETRRKQNRYARNSWRYPSRSITQASKEELYKFFLTVDSGLQSFLFIDPEKPWLDKMPLTFSDTDIWVVQASNEPIDATSEWYNYPASKSVPYFFAPHLSYSAVTGLTDWVVEVTRDNGNTWVDESANATFYAPVSNGPIYMTLADSTGVGKRVRITGSNVRVGRLNSTLSWSVGAMTVDTAGNQVPIGVDMTDLEIIEVFEGLSS